MIFHARIFFKDVWWYMNKILSFLKKSIPLLLPILSVFLIAVILFLTVWPQLDMILTAGSIFIRSEVASDQQDDSDDRNAFDENVNYEDQPYIYPEGSESVLPTPPDSTLPGDGNAGTEGSDEDQNGDSTEDDPSSGKDDKDDDDDDPKEEKPEKQTGYKQELGNVTYPKTYILSSNVTYPSYMEHYAMVDIYGRDVKVYFSDSTKALSKGAGQSMGSMPPGFGRPILLGGHNNSYFKNLKKYIVGDVITVKTNYGIYYYRVYDTKIAMRDDYGATHMNLQKEELILYTCYPFTTLRLTKKRYFVYAEKIAGPTVVDSLDQIPAAVSDSISSENES